MSNLEAERQRLLDRIAEICSTGQVAPSHTFLGEVTTVSKTGKTYRYARLVTQKQTGGKQKTKSLGRLGGEQHRQWQRAIARRDAIVELEMQLTMLTALIERQKVNQGIVEQDFVEPEEGVAELRYE